jgi:hypothetical protein
MMPMASWVLDQILLLECLKDYEKRLEVFLSFFNDNISRHLRQQSMQSYWPGSSINISKPAWHVACGRNGSRRNNGALAKAESDEAEQQGRRVQGIK